MSHASIKAWLEDPSPNYFIGLSLLGSVSRSVGLLKTLSRGPSRYNTPKLQYELEKYISTHRDPDPGLQDAIIIQRGSAYGTVVPDPTSRTAPDPSGDLLLDAVLEERFKLYRHRDQTHAVLMYLKTDQERFQAAEEILSLQRKIEMVKAKIDYYKKHGSLPEQITKDPEAETQQKIRNVRTYISKYKKKLSGDLTAAQRSSYEKKLQAKITELNELQK